MIDRTYPHASYETYLKLMRKLPLAEAGIENRTGSRTRSFFFARRQVYSLPGAGTKSSTEIFSYLTTCVRPVIRLTSTSTTTAPLYTSVYPSASSRCLRRYGVLNYDILLVPLPPSYLLVLGPFVNLLPQHSDILVRLNVSDLVKPFLKPPCARGNSVSAILSQNLQCQSILLLCWGKSATSFDFLFFLGIAAS